MRKHKLVVEKIISGGQTGADRGALDAAISCGFPYGGAIPAGRMTEAGRLPESYVMEELASDRYPDRTARNVHDSDGTLIVTHGNLTGGSALTETLAIRHGKPCLHLDLTRVDQTAGLELLAGWLVTHGIRVLNVAGTRASGDPNIYSRTRSLIRRLLQEKLRDSHDCR